VILRFWEHTYFVANSHAREHRRRLVRLLIIGPLAVLLVGLVSATATLISRPVPAFAQTPIPASAEISLITDHLVPSVFAGRSVSDSSEVRPDCAWASDAEAGVLSGPDVVHWGDGRSICGYSGSAGEFLVYVLPTWETKDNVVCKFGLLLAAGQGGCLTVTDWGRMGVFIRVDGHYVGVLARTIVDRHELLGFANMVSLRMKGNLGDIDRIVMQR
jgi:hypothetical protein